MDKSRASKINYIENTVNTVAKSRSISRTSLSTKSTRIEKPSEIDICNNNLSISVFYGHREILSGVTSYKQRIPSKNKRKKTSDTLIMGK